MSEAAVRERTQNKGHNRKFDIIDERVLAGYIILRDCRRLNTGSDVLSRFALRRYKKHIGSPWTTRFCTRQDLSFRTIIHSSLGEFLRYRRDRAVEVLDEIRGLLKAPRNIWAFDKKPFTDRSDSGQQIGPLGSYT